MTTPERDVVHEAIDEDASVSSVSTRLLPVLAAVVAALVATLAIRVWLSGTNDPDSMASVLYFQRIIAGDRLEVTVLTTPKPLLTIAYGLTWNVLHDWRALVAETIAVHALGVALATRVAIRLAGLPAGLFVAISLIGSSTQLTEVAGANSFVWGFAAWSLAALAVTAKPRRFWLAGGALAVGGMVRIETWLIVAGATLALAVLASPAVRRSRHPSWPSVRSALPLLIGWLAVPAQLLHDLLLTGNPLYWSSVPTAYTLLVTPNLSSVTPIEFAQALVDRLTPMRWSILLTLAGVAYLAIRRRWAMLVGLGSLVAGSTFLLMWLAARATFISDRYYEEPIVGLQLAAAVGMAGALRLGASALRLHWGPVVRLGQVVVAALVALFLTRAGPLPPASAGRLAILQAASSRLETIMPILRRSSEGTVPSEPQPLPAPGGFTRVNPRTALALVPRIHQRRIAVELSLRLTSVADTFEALRAEPLSDILRLGQVVYHDKQVDQPQALYVDLEVDRTLRIDADRTLVPLAVNRGLSWLLAVRR